MLEKKLINRSIQISAESYNVELPKTLINLQVWFLSLNILVTLLSNFIFINNIFGLSFIYHKLMFKSLPLFSGRSKFRKWKYKKKKVSKKKLLRRIRKFLIHKKRIDKVFSKMFSFNYFSYKLNIINRIELINRAPLTERILQTSYLECFYKLNKEPEDIKNNSNNFTNLKSYEDDKNDITIFLRNFHQKPYWKLRLSRILHWNFFFKRKAIREQRYKSFLPNFLKKQKKYTNISIYLLTLFTNMKISWTRAQKLTSFLKKNFIIKVSNSIFFLPRVLSTVINWKLLKKKNFAKKKKIGRWSFLNYKRWQSPWLQKKKNFPKLIKHVQPNMKVFKKLTHFDPLTGYLLFFKNVNNYELSFSESLKVNMLVKLHMYRYNSN